MELVDLTFPVAVESKRGSHWTAREMKLACRGGEYTGMVYDLHHDSMQGTYIDFPGHIKETDDGTHAENYPLEKLFRVKAGVIHLDRESESGAVEARDLEANAPDLSGCGGLILNALGAKRFDAIKSRSVWIAPDAGAWIASTGIHLFVSDIYECNVELTGIFNELFGAGITTIQWPVNLDRLTTPYVYLTALPARYPGVTQLPCRLVAEVMAP